jgi:hypothetical protein
MNSNPKRFRLRGKLRTCNVQVGSTLRKTCLPLIPAGLIQPFALDFSVVLACRSLCS